MSEQKVKWNGASEQLCAQGEMVLLQEGVDRVNGKTQDLKKAHP